MSAAGEPLSDHVPGLEAETEALRRHLATLAREAERDALHARYPLIARPPPGAGPVRRLRIGAGKLLRRLGLRRAREQWRPTLNHQEEEPDARPLVIWALGVERETLRRACVGFDALRAYHAGFVPVLVTDVADFEFFSRLGWLVEYVPAFTAPAVRYASRKAGYIAWRYRGAPAVPATLGLAAGSPAAQRVLENALGERKAGRGAESRSGIGAPGAGR